MRYKREVLIITDNRIRRCWDNIEEEWLYCITDVVRYVAKTKDPIDYLFRLRCSSNDLQKQWESLIIKVSLITSVWKRNLNCMNLSWLWRVFRAIPKKYDGRKRYFKTRVE